MQSRCLCLICSDSAIGANVKLDLLMADSSAPLWDAVEEPNGTKLTNAGNLIM